MSRGCLIGRSLRNAIGLPVADAATLTGLPAKDPRHFNGAITVKVDDNSLWTYNTTSAAALGTDVLASTYGPGQWLRGGGSGALGVGSVNLKAARYASAGALAAYTRTGNVILADAVGALGAQDGVTGAAGDVFCLVDGAADADNGLYRIDVIGAAGAAYQMTRIGGADASAEVTAGMLVYVSEGTTHGNEWAFLTTDDAIVLNTTALVFAWVPSLVDLASVADGLGGDLIGLYDAGNIITAANVTDAIQENRTALDVAEARVLVNEGELDTHRPGVPMINRLIMLGAPGAIVALDTVTIGTDIYEFNAATPPAGGTAGSIWIYQGANSAASRANFINAVNGVIDAPNITYDGAVVETMLAVAGTTLGTVDVRSADAIGGAITPSAVATACTEVLTTVTDIWDQATMYAGQAQGATQQQSTTVTLTAAEITAGFLEIEFDFTPTSIISVLNRDRPACPEAVTITADRVVLTLAGGAAPNHQAADVVDITVQG